MKKRAIFLVLIWMLVLPACVAKSATQQDIFSSLTPPAMIVIITRENCPSMEVQVGTQVAWTNGDTISHPIILEELDDHGNILTTGQLEINTETFFSVRFDHAGVYHFYCSRKRDLYATITVK